MGVVTVSQIVIRGYHGKGFGARFVKILPYRRISHVSLVFYFTDGTAIEYHAIQGKGVTHNEPATGESFEACVPSLSLWQMQAAYAKAREIVGGYDWRAIFSFFVPFMSESETRWMCSEYVAEIMAAVGNRLSKREPFSETPTFIMDSNDAGPRAKSYET